MGLRGIHVREKDGSEVHVGWDGIHVEDRKKNNSVHVENGHVYVNGKEYEENLRTRFLHAFPYTMLMIIVYIVIGFLWNMWHPGWIIFLTIPLWDSLIMAIARRDANCFAYPVAAVIVFLLLGFYKNMWHPGWVVFLTIPLYYGVIGSFRAIFGGKKKGNQDPEADIVEEKEET